MVCITIPYSKGWKASIDGREAKIYKINGMYMGVMVGKGEHKIELHYITLGIKTGASVSIAAWILFGIILVFWGKKEEITL